MEHKELEQGKDDEEEYVQQGGLEGVVGPGAGEEGTEQDDKQSEQKDDQDGEQGKKRMSNRRMGRKEMSSPGKWRGPVA